MKKDIFPKNFYNTSMRYWGILLLITAMPLWAHEEPEIVIELTGTPDKTTVADGLNIWNKNTQQLKKLLHGKTREEVLYQVSSVSSKDHIVKAEDDTRYAFVQYGITPGMRRLLFRAKDPQTLITCATTAPEALEMVLRYRIDVGLTLTELTAAYTTRLTPVELPSGTKETLYKLTRKNKLPVFLLFNQDKLTRTLNQEQADHFIRQAKEAAEQAAKKAAEEARARAAKNNPPPVRKLLIDGGTVEDQMYLPRVENAENLPHLIPGKIPAGTPLWPQTIQAQTSPRP